jgi:lysozyme
VSIKIVQTMLKEAGFDPGPIDGKWGTRTLGALQAALADRAPVQPTGETDPNDTALIAELLRDEGFVPHAYQDSLGYWTIGIGRLIDRRKGGGITRAEAEYLKRNDIARFKAELDRDAPWWRELDPVRQRVILNMTFNLGAGWIDEFKNTVGFIRNGEYDRASRGMLASAWARQVGARAQRLAAMMRTGEA